LLLISILIYVVMYQIINTNVLLLANEKDPDMLSVVQQHIQQQKQIKQPLPIDITSRQGTVISISSD
ncbi:MAG: hypothetical protein WBP64_03020, partial [Nitrososphaeraceae archaeon]